MRNEYNLISQNQAGPNKLKLITVLSNILITHYTIGYNQPL